MQRTFQWFIYIKRPISCSMLSLTGTERFEWSSVNFQILPSYNQASVGRVGLRRTRPHPVLVPKIWNLYRPRPVPSLGRARTRTVPGRLVPSNGPLLITSKRMTAPAKPKQMSPFGLVSKFLPGPPRLLELRNIRKRPEQRFWFTRWTLKPGLIEIWMRILKLSLSNQTRLESKQIRELKVPGVTMKERIKAQF